MSFAAIVINGLIFCLTSDAIGAAIHNTCQFAFQHVDVTTNPQNMMTSLSWSEQGCVNFCSGMYQSQKFHNPSIYLGPCGTRHLINPVSKQPYSSCKTIPSPNDVECTAALPCPGPEGPDGQLSLTNNCDSPFLCNPVPLRVPVRSAKSLVGKQSVEDWSRAYCQESPRINLGSGQWRFETATQIYAWNPFLNNFASSGNISDFPAYTSVKTYEYGMIACTLLCAPGVECPYSQKQPKFNPQLQREESFKPMDYISPSLLNQIQLSASVKCVKDDKLVYGPPGDNKYCFLCPSEDLELTVPVVGLDNFNEIVFTTAFGPSVAALWSVLIFEHVVFFIKFLVMALIPDITEEIENQLQGHDTYRRRLAMKRNVGNGRDETGTVEQIRSNLVAALEPDALSKLPEDNELWDPRPMTLDMVKQVFAGSHEVTYTAKRKNQALNESNV